MKEEGVVIVGLCVLIHKKLSRVFEVLTFAR